MAKSIVTPLALMADRTPCVKAVWSYCTWAPTLMFGSTAFMEL